MSQIALWFLIVNLGIAFGAGVYEDRMMVPRWLRTSAGTAHWHGEAAREDNPGLRFWAFVSTGPLTLITLVNLFAAWQSAGAIPAWWLAAAVASLAERLFTFSYFIPTMLSLIDAPDTPESVAAATRWLRLNALRHAMTLAAWLMGLKALTLVGR